MTIEIFFSFITGVFLTLGGVFVTYLFQKRLEKNKEKEKLRYEIYMNLLDISSYYFWVTSAEVHNEKPSAENLKLLRDLTFKTSDKLRQVDDIEYLDEILDVLFSEKYETAKARAEKFEELLKKLHNLVSPKFVKKIKQIIHENQLAFLSKPLDKFNAPGKV